MSTEQMFEKASRLKLVFLTSGGSLDVSDLWDLPLTSKASRVNLDDIARGLHKRIKDAEEVSFVTPATGPSTALNLQFEIVKHVIATLIAERDAAQVAAAKAARKQQLLELIAKKERGDMEELSLDQLKAMLETETA